MHNTPSCYCSPYLEYTMGLHLNSTGPVAVVATQCDNTICGEENLSLHVCLGSISGRLELSTYVPIRSTIYLPAGWMELSIDIPYAARWGGRPHFQVISLFYAITISPLLSWVSIKKCSTSQSSNDWVRRKRPIKGSDSIDDDGDAASRWLSIYSYWQTVGTTSTWSVSQSDAQESLPEIFLWPPSYKNVTNFIIRSQ